MLDAITSPTLMADRQLERATDVKKATYLLGTWPYFFGA
jgi:hypothetical protein